MLRKLDATMNDFAHDRTQSNTLIGAASSLTHKPDRRPSRHPLGRFLYTIPPVTAADYSLKRNLNIKMHY